RGRPRQTVPGPNLSGGRVRDVGDGLGASTVRPSAHRRGPTAPPPAPLETPPLPVERHTAEPRATGAGRRPSALPYLPGIDALRAVAVLAVLLYHAEVSWLPGGFLGVDVFFVISGYLITALLVSERTRTGR